MKKRLAFLLSILLFSLSTLAQEEAESNFKQKGKIFGTAFIDYSAGLNSKNNESGFDITRALLGYKHQFSQNWEATVSLDGAAGKKDDRLEVYLRNAYVRWKNDQLQVNIGLIPYNMFELQQGVWGHRYLMKSAQDEYKVGNSVDLGVSAYYKINPLLSVDMSIVNGEGYKTIRKDQSVRYALGVTLTLYDNFVFRIYGDLYSTDRKEFDKLEIDRAMKTQYTFSSFVGYRSDRFQGGVEYNRQMNNEYVDQRNLDVISSYLTYSMNKKWNLYGRYDYTHSSDEEKDVQWFDDNHTFVIGVEYKPFSFLKISPNFRNINYRQSASNQFIFVSGELKF